MPLKTNTVSDLSYKPSGSFVKTILHMAMSVSKVIGSNYKIISDTDVSKQYFIPTDAIGFPGLGIFFEVNEGPTTDGSDDLYKCGIFNTLSDGVSPDMSEGSPNITQVFKGANFKNSLPYCPETCVMIYDNEKDTVLFDVHPGSTVHGTDLEGFSDYASRRARLSFALFLAKDEKGGVLCGIGNGHISSLRTLTSKMDAASDITSSQRDHTNSDILHLTKMVNYLDPSYPEMKSAYVSLIRPMEAPDGKLYVSKLYSNGKRWGRAGLIDSWPQQYNTTAYPVCPSFFPIEPFVNY